MAGDTTTAWLDLVSPSHPFLFRGLVAELSDVEVRTTVRRKTETVDLAAIAGFDYEVIGRDFDNTFLRKIGIPLRTAQLCVQAPAADVSLSSRNAMCVLASKARGVPSIHFTDNDITAHVSGLRVEELYNRFEARATHNVVPAAFETEELTKWGASPSQIHTYDGYKEDIYVSNFEPDESFTETLPFEDYVVLRPEALDAAYVSAERSLVPDILERAHDAGLNVVYLPRGRNDEAYADPYPPDQTYVPDGALDGLELAWHSDGVLTGSGTMAREAACMDKPAVSFFPGPLLSVDRRMVDEGMLVHSRDADEIVDYLQSLSGADLRPDRTRSRRVFDSVVGLVEDLVETASESERGTPLDHSWTPQ